jgi:hypothetical protein
MNAGYSNFDRAVRERNYQVPRWRIDVNMVLSQQRQIVETAQGQDRLGLSRTIKLAGID